MPKNRDAEKRALARRDGAVCFYCGRTRKNPLTMTIEHLLLALGDDPDATTVLKACGVVSPVQLNADQLIRQDIVARAALTPTETQWLAHCKQAMADAAPAHNLPAWLAENLQAQLGSQFDAAAAALLQTAPLDLRVNMLHSKREAVLKALEQKGILGGLSVEGGILWCATERNTTAQIDALISAVKGAIA